MAKPGKSTRLLAYQIEAIHQGRRVGIDEFTPAEAYAWVDKMKDRYPGCKFEIQQILQTTSIDYVSIDEKEFKRHAAHPTRIPVKIPAKR